VQWVVLVVSNLQWIDEILPNTVDRSPICVNAPANPGDMTLMLRVKGVDDSYCCCVSWRLGG